MKKLDASVKSRGILIFAFNTKHTDYVEIAARAARLARTNLGLPTTLITDSDVTSEYFDQVIKVKNDLVNYKPGPSTIWRNGDRYRAYELSPYDETLLIDSDYLILDDSLTKLFVQDFDYRIMSYNHCYSNQIQDKMGEASLPYQWATVILFRKSARSEMLFNLVGRIQRNYRYYLKLYGIRASNYRNDYAFTIANNILNGYDIDFNQGIVWPMLTFSEPIDSIVFEKNLLTIKESDRAYVIPKQNIHVMDKGYLLSDNYLDLINKICQE